MKIRLPLLIFILSLSVSNLRALDDPDNNAASASSSPEKHATESSSKRTDVPPAPQPAPDDSKPAPDPLAFHLMTGVGAVLAGIENTSYGVTNDALIAKNVAARRPKFFSAVVSSCLGI